MNSQYLDMAAILDRFLDRAVQNLTIEKLLLQLHLDPSNISFDAIFHRLVEIVLVNITLANVCALIAAGLYAATFLMVDGASEIDRAGEFVHRATGQ